MIHKTEIRKASMRNKKIIEFIRNEVGAELLEVALIIGASLTVMLGIASFGLSSIVEAGTCGTLARIVAETQDVYNATHKLDEARAYANSQVSRLFNYGISASPSAIYRAEPYIEMRQDVPTNSEVNYITISPPGAGVISGTFQEGGTLVDDFGNEVAYSSDSLIYNPININSQVLNGIIYHIPNLSDQQAAIYRMTPTIASFRYTLQFLGAEFSTHSCNIPFYPDVLTTDRVRYAGDPNQPAPSIDDPDNDGILTSAGDNCSKHSNASQTDSDSDGIGDQCDRDSDAYLMKEPPPIVETCNIAQPDISAAKESCSSFAGAIFDLALCLCRCMTMEEFFDNHNGPRASTIQTSTMVPPTDDPTCQGFGEIIEKTTCLFRPYPIFNFPPQLCFACNTDSIGIAHPPEFPCPKEGPPVVTESVPSVSTPPVVTEDISDEEFQLRELIRAIIRRLMSLAKWMNMLASDGCPGPGGGCLLPVNGVPVSDTYEWWKQHLGGSPPAGLLPSAGGWLCGTGLVPCRTNVVGDASDTSSHPQFTGMGHYDCFYDLSGGVVLNNVSPGLTVAQFTAARNNPALWLGAPWTMIKAATVTTNEAGGEDLCKTRYDAASLTTIAAAAQACTLANPTFVFDVDERTMQTTCSPDPTAASSGCGAGFSGTTFAPGCIDPLTCQTDAGGLLAATGCVCLSPGSFDANGVCVNPGGTCTGWAGANIVNGCTGTVANAANMGGGMWSCNGGDAINIAPLTYLCPNMPGQMSMCMPPGGAQGNCNLTAPMVAPAGAGCSGTTGMTMCSCLNGGSVFTSQAGGRLGCD